MRILSFLLFIVLSACVTIALPKPNNTGSILTLNLNDESVMYIDSIIDQKYKNKICKNLRKYENNTCKNRSEIKYLVLNSPGGDIQIAYNIAMMVKYSNITTVIPPNGICESACTIIFQAGKERHASKNSSLMYHGARLGRAVMQAYFKECSKMTNQCMQIFKKWKFLAKKETIKIFHILEEYGLKHDVFLLFIKQPIDPDWLKYGNLTGYSDLRFTAEEAMQYNAVTKIVEYQIIK